MKLTSIELKKYFKHPATYIISALLILVMLVSIMTYKPTLESDFSVKKMYASYDVDISNYNEVYDYFIKDQAHMSKFHFDLNIEACSTYLDSHNPIEPSNNITNNLNAIIQQIENKLATGNCDISHLLTAFENEIKNSTIEGNEDFYAVITNKSKTSFNSIISNARNILNSGLPDTAKIEQLKSSNLVANLTNNLTGFKNFLPNSADFENAKQYYNKGLALIEELRDKISLLPTTDGDLITLFKYIEEYNNLTNNTYFIVKNQIMVSAIYNIGESESKNYLGINQINTYQFKELVTKDKYLLDYYAEHKQSLNYVEPINIAYTYINNVNIADYVGFVATLCAFVIVVYISIMGAMSVNREINTGTMRMIATKPFKKNKIITGKIWATILYGLILLGLSFVVSVIMGGIAYGFSTAPALIVLNASIAFTLNVYIELLLFLITLALPVILFASLSVLFSTLIKNSILTAAITCVLYFTSIVFNIVTVNISFLPFTNINIWKYFGGSFLITNERNFFSLLFNGTPVATNTIIINIISFALFIVLAQVLTHIIFKKKEIR